MPTKKKTMEVSTYDINITIKKFAIQMLLVAAIAALTWMVEVGLPELSLGLPEYATIFALVSAVVIALVNYLKHYQDKKEIEV